MTDVAPCAAAGPVVPLRVVVADDEPVALRRLVRLLREEPCVEVVAACDGGHAALAAVRRHRPDAVLLDVEMPALDGLAVARRLADERRADGPGAPMPAVVFVTAYDAYALDAFRVQALHYVLKPVDRAQVREAVARARRAVLLDRAAAAPPIATERGAGGGEPARLVVRDGFTEHHVALADVRHIESFGNYARVHTAARRLIHRGTMRDLAERLAPHGFVRVHRAGIVNVACVTALRRRAGGRCEVVLASGARLRVGRTQRAALQAALEARQPRAAAPPVEDTRA